MNERIRELAVQAEKLADEATNAYNDDTGNWRKVWNKIYDEKFAELIVRECEAILKKDMELAHIQLIPLDFKMYANGRLQRTIKEHFGIE